MSMSRKGDFFRYREKIPSPAAIGIGACVYFFGALGVYAVDHIFLLSAWLAAGFLAVSLYYTLDAKKALVNAYTVCFSVMVIGNLVGYLVRHLE